ncbi:MAG TPA: thiolase family protein [Chloroflexia bacterium]|nr:thiolase family protein [Chloroflexia bacterium]
MAEPSKVGTPLDQLSDREAVIVSAVRTPVGRASKGSLKDMRPDDLGALAVKAALERAGNLDPALVEDVIFGCAMPEGEQGLNIGRNISVLAGIPTTSAGVTVNRFCASGLQSANMAAQNILLGMGDVFVSGGVECMSRVPMGGFNPSFNKKLVGGKAGFPEVYIPMGLTAENVAKQFNVSRQEQDEFALRSHMLAVKAQQEGMFKDEIVPVTLPDGSIADKDDGPRADTSLEKLATLKAAFIDGGTVTAGNSSPLNDGAAAAVIMSLGKARELGLKPLARFVTLAVAGVDPEVMGIGPIPAVRKALQRAGLTIQDIDIVELNEAFASQALVVTRELGISLDKQLNPKGGAIAIGHPLGCSGARILATLMNDMRQYDATLAIETMCIGGGMGLATIFERLS